MFHRDLSVTLLLATFVIGMIATVVLDTPAKYHAAKQKAKAGPSA